jgi:hypothetical protein
MRKERNLNKTCVFGSKTVVLQRLFFTDEAPHTSLMGRKLRQVINKMFSNSPSS